VTKAEYTDKSLVVGILSQSFDDNKSVNYLLPQDGQRDQRLRKFMEYSFDVCHLFGDVFLSDDRKGCTLILLPDKKKTNLKSTLLDLKFIFQSIGLSNVKKAISRESEIKKHHPKEPLYYLWFIGVDENEQNKGIGSKLLSEVVEEGRKQNRTVCLETSTVKNLPWYQKFGFEIYKELDFGYKLYCMKLPS
jgi:ribosomal protein S18 acetylase RimI-like enzyme